VNNDLKVIDGQTEANSQFDDQSIDNEGERALDPSKHGSESSGIEIVEPTDISD
jgi:hypothetical protein